MASRRHTPGSLGPSQWAPGAEFSSLRPDATAKTPPCGKYFHRAWRRRFWPPQDL